MKEVLAIGVRTTKEAKKVVDAGRLLIDGKKAQDYRRIVGLMDTISIPETKQYFRVVLNERGRLSCIAIDEKEAGQKAAKIVKKMTIKGGKVMVTLSDGRNLPGQKDYKIGDTLIIEVPSQKVIKHLPLKEGNYAVLLGGKHIGKGGSITQIDEKHVVYKGKDEEARTLRSYVLVLGTKSPEVKIHE